MLGYLTLIVGLLLVVCSIWASVWLARRGNVVQQTSDAGEGLRSAAQMLGLDEVRESRLFQARVLAAWGDVNEFRVNCELWEQIQDPFYRITIEFPKPLLRGIRISRDEQGGLLHQVVDAEEEQERAASDEILVQSNQDMGELRMFLQDDLRKPLERLAARVNRLQMGDEYLYLYVKSAPDGAFCGSLLRESLAVARKVFGRALELGPSKKSSKTSSYGQAKTEMSRRANVEVEVEGRPEEPRSIGKVTLASMAAILAHEDAENHGHDVDGDSIWARRPPGVEEKVVSEASTAETGELRGEKESDSDHADANTPSQRASFATLPGVGK